MYSSCFSLQIQCCTFLASYASSSLKIEFSVCVLSIPQDWISKAAFENVPSSKICLNLCQIVSFHVPRYVLWLSCAQMLTLREYVWLSTQRAGSLLRPVGAFFLGVNSNRIGTMEGGDVKSLLPCLLWSWDVGPQSNFYSLKELGPSRIGLQYVPCHKQIGFRCVASNLSVGVYSSCGEQTWSSCSNHNISVIWMEIWRGQWTATLVSVAYESSAEAQFPYLTN